MSRELNPELFGEKRVSIEAPAVVGERLPEPDFLDVDRQILELRNQNQKVQVQMAEMAKSSNLKIEKLQQQVSRLETIHNGLAGEIGNRLNQMQARIIERASYDAKTQEMIDRHNQVIKSFEVRMTQLQRILQEKEAQLNTTLQALNDAKTEIMRLKRI
jgi:DNA repair exonuclease SbcCD ATPase subunit